MVTSEQNFFQHRQEALRGDEGFISLRRAKMYGVGAVALAVAGLVAGGINNLRHTDIVEVEKTIEVQGPTGTITEEFTLDPMTCYGGWKNDAMNAGALEKLDIALNLGPFSIDMPFDKDLLWWQITSQSNTTNYFCPKNAVVERVVDLDKKTISLTLQEGAEFDVISFMTDPTKNYYDPESGIGAEAANQFDSWIDKIPNFDPKTTAQIDSELKGIVDVVTFVYSVNECGEVALNDMAPRLERAMIENEEAIAEDYLSQIGIPLSEMEITANIAGMTSATLTNQYEGLLESKEQEAETKGFSLDIIMPEEVAVCEISDELVVTDRTSVEEGRG